MLIPNSIWYRIRDEFTETDKVALRVAVNGSIVCPPSTSIDERILSPTLRSQVEAAMARFNPGA